METHVPYQSGASHESGDSQELPVVEFLEPDTVGQEVRDLAGEGPRGAEFAPLAPPIALPPAPPDASPVPPPLAPPISLVAAPPIAPPVGKADSSIDQDPPGIVPMDDQVGEEDRLRDSASFAGSALIHSAALVVLAVFTSATIKRDAVVWIAEPASPVVDTPLSEPVQVEMPAESNSVASALSNAAQAEIPAHEMTVATAELVADEPMLGDVDQVAHASLPGSADRDRAPVDRLLDVVATRKKTAVQSFDQPDPSAIDSPMAMARAATVGVPHWGNTPAERAVYRFILYDIGRLQGLEAAEAQFAFSSLPNEALPELIKGLNASAYLQASCPVVVLSSRVQSSLASLNSREAYEYALKNIGKGVPANANYAAHLASLRQRLAAESGMTSGANPGLLQPLREQRSRWVMQLQHASSSRLTAALASENADERWAATRVIAARGLKLMDELIPLLADEDIMVREETHAALVRLARGIDLGPVNSSSESEVDESIDLWRRWWSQNKERQGVSEYTSQQDEALRLRRANNRISLAEKLMADGHSQAANRYLEEVIRDYPGTASADRAEELKRELTEK
ncbi:MAG: hypothetical protein U1A77_02105 [Pirellulales bacterium]